MNRHLSPAESIAALDGTLAADRRAHLDACAACRTELAELRATLSAVSGTDDLQEPPAAFWDDLSASVRAATAGGRQEPRPMWLRTWQPLAALAAAAMVAIWALGRGPAEAPPVREAPQINAAAADSLPDAADRWDAIVELAADLSVDDVHRAVPSRLDSVVLFDELSPEERAALGDLLASELNEQNGLD